MTSPYGTKKEEEAQPGAALAPNPDQVNEFHRYDDSDNSPESHHHTLGVDPNQASPGDHNHDGRNSFLISDQNAASPGANTGVLLGWGSVAAFNVTATSTRIKVSVNLEFTSTQDGGMTVTVTGHNTVVMNSNVMTCGGSGTAAGRAISTSQTKFFNCDIGDIITITPGSFTGTINQVEIYVESAA